MDEKPATVTTEDDGTYKVDVDAFAPNPEGHVVVHGVKYPVFHFMDIPIADSLAVTRLSENMEKADDMEKRLELSIEQVLILNKPAARAGLPVLTRRTFDDVTPRQIISLTVMASMTARVPLVTDRPESGESAASPSPSPESVASTAGGSGSSSD